LAQTNQLWSEPATMLKSSDSWWDPVAANRKELNLKALDELLNEMKLKGTTKITLPHPTGSDISVDIKPSNLLSKELQEKYPEIQTFKGYTPKGELVRIDVNPGGINAMVFSNEGNIYLDPMTYGSKQHVCYFEDDFISIHADKFPSLHNDIDEDNVLANALKSANNRHFTKRTVGDKFKKYRIAIMVKSTFTNHPDRGGRSVDKAYEGIVTILNRTTGLYETQLALTFELVTGKEMVFTDKGPFESEMNNLRTGRNDRIVAIEYLNDEQTFGVDKYDVGHVIAAGQDGGTASLGRVCIESLKASGMSCIPYGRSYDHFALGTFAHEVGHQFGAHHTFSSQEGSCGNDQYSIHGAYEIGSGITIMSYSGYCGDNNIITGRATYFHARSFENILSFITDDNGNRCGTYIDTDNTPPVVTVREGGFTIPMKTPFVLEAEAHDDDGDTVIYNWEQYDGSGTPENMIGTNEEGPVSREEYGTLFPPETSEAVIDLLYENYMEQFAAEFRGDGPLFRNFMPTTDNKRYFPQLSTIISGDSTITEVLPFFSRELNFVVSVADEKGGKTNDIVTFSSTDQAGPFVVTSSFSESPYTGFSTTTVEWDVANTDKSPVNCSKVDILFSDNGGESFDYVLLANTDNDGSENIQLPNIETAKARVMVKASNSIFFHVNDADFQINSTDVDIPEAPINLTGNQVTIHKVELSWEDNSTVENGFIVERKLEGSANFEKIGETGFDITTYTDMSADNTKTYSYRVAAQNAKGTSGYSNTVTLSLSSMDNISYENEVIYPNPTNGFIYLPASLSKTAERLVIFNMQGKIIYNMPINSQLEKVDVSALSNGLYFMKIFAPNSEMVRKFVKE
ncbi:MAG: M12 family metallo-peptidase, partial [Bacteroidales bacterium]|nr:M12 family metallo-peptidase [Bacteroidales bacterium]